MSRPPQPDGLGDAAMPAPRLLVWASWAGLIWEQVWPEIWAIPTLLAAFCAAFLLGLLPVGPLWFQDLLWLAGAIALAGLYLAAIAAIR